MDSTCVDQQLLESPTRPPLTPPGLSSSPTPPRLRSSLCSRGSIGHRTPLDCCKARQQHPSFDGSSPLSRKSLRYSLRAPDVAHHQQLSSQPSILLPVLPILTVLPATRPRSLLHQQSIVIASHVRVFSSSDTDLSTSVALSNKPHNHGRATLPRATSISPAGIRISVGNRPANLKSSPQGMRNLRPLPPLQHSQSKTLMP